MKEEMEMERALSVKGVGSEGASGEVGEFKFDSRMRAGRPGCWMVIAAVTSVWGQTDLWMEAEEMFSTPEAEP